MLYGHFHRDAQPLGRESDGWANSHLGYEVAMATTVAICVVLTGAVLFLPVWVR